MLLFYFASVYVVILSIMHFLSHWYDTNPYAIEFFLFICVTYPFYLLHILISFFNFNANFLYQYLFHPSASEFSLRDSIQRGDHLRLDKKSTQTHRDLSSKMCGFSFGFWLLLIIGKRSQLPK